MNYVFFSTKLVLTKTILRKLKINKAAEYLIYFEASYIDFENSNK